MNSYTLIPYAGTYLEVFSFLVDLWPYELEPGNWPTFCGPGDGIGDVIVPDCIGPRFCANISPACFQHDLDRALCDGSRLSFDLGNNRFYRNMESLCRVQTNGLEDFISSQGDCELYYQVVSLPPVWAAHKPCGDLNWRTNPGVQDKLRRLQDRVRETSLAAFTI